MKNNLTKASVETASDLRHRTAKPGRVSGKVVRLFKQCGYLRTPPDAKQNGHPRASGHRGYEVRFMAHSRDECHKIVQLLKANHIETGKPFNKGQQWRVPVYGHDLFVTLRNSR